MMVAGRESVVGSAVLVVLVAALVLFFDLLKGLLMMVLRASRWYSVLEGFVLAQPWLLAFLLFVIIAFLMYVLQQIKWR